MGLYRDDGLFILRRINKQQTDKIKSVFSKILTLKLRLLPI